MREREREGHRIGQYSKSLFIVAISATGQLVGRIIISALLPELIFVLAICSID